MYYFALDLETLDGLLPQRVEDSVIREANRRLTPSHARNIRTYLDERDDWLLGALMLGIAPDAVEFEPYPDEQGEPANSGFGELRIRTNRVNTMRIFDGQHRRRAIQDLLAELSNARGSRNVSKLDSLRRSSMSIVLYAEDNIRTLRQMFVDASKTKRPELHTVARFDQRDPFNLVALQLAEQSRLFAGRVEMERSTIPRASQCLVAINQLAAILKILEVGNGRRVTRDLNDSYMLNRGELYKRSLVWTDEFMVSAREEYEGMASGEIDNSEIPQLRPTTLAYNFRVIRILAGCYHAWAMDDWRPLAQFIRRASLSPGYDPSALLVKAGMVAPDGTLFGRRQEVGRAIDYIVKAAEATVEDGAV